MGIEQIALFMVSWFAVGFLVALGVGGFLREAGRLGQMEIELPARGAAHARMARRPALARKEPTEASTPDTRPERRPR